MRAGSRRAMAGLALAVALAGAAVVALDAVGRGARRVLPGHEVIAVADEAGALAAWRAAGVRGRVLLFLGRTLPLAPVDEAAVRAYLADPDAPAPAVEESFVYLALRANLVRRVVYLVPDDRWAAFAEVARQRSEMFPHGAGFIWFPEGLPIVSLPARERAAVLEERPLVYATATTRESFGEAIAAELTSDPRADLVVVVQ